MKSGKCMFTNRKISFLLFLAIFSQYLRILSWWICCVMFTSASNKSSESRTTTTSLSNHQKKTMQVDHFIRRKWLGSYNWQQDWLNLMKQLERAKAHEPSLIGFLSSKQPWLALQTQPRKRHRTVGVRQKRIIPKRMIGPMKRLETHSITPNETLDHPATRGCVFGAEDQANTGKFGHTSKLGCSLGTVTLSCVFRC